MLGDWKRFVVLCRTERDRVSVFFDISFVIGAQDSKEREGKREKEEKRKK